MADKKSNDTTTTAPILTASYEKDSKRYRRYTIDDGQGIVGNIYVPLDVSAPSSITINLTE